MLCVSGGMRLLQCDMCLEVGGGVPLCWMWMLHVLQHVDVFVLDLGAV